MAEPTDPLLRDVELPLVARRQLLGRPVEFHTNSRVVLEHVLDLTGGELKTSSADGFVPVARLVLIRHEVPATSLSHREVLYRMPQPNRLLISAGQSFGVVETDSAHGVAYLSDALIADREFLKRAFIEAMSLRLITGPERYPIHAALVGTGSNALLLTGNSGSGKSTLAYLASQRRLTTYSEDVVYVQRSPDVRIWTRPTAITLLPDVARKYSDIEHIPTTRLATGKDKVVINDGIQTGSEFLKRIGVCLLCPGRSTASVTRLTATELRDALNALPVDEGFDVFDQQVRTGVHKAVSHHGGWQLNLCADPEDSVPLIRQMLAELENRSDT